jgi:hypothetical protein
MKSLFIKKNIRKRERERERERRGGGSLRKLTFGTLSECSNYGLFHDYIWACCSTSSLNINGNYIKTGLNTTNKKRYNPKLILNTTKVIQTES